MAKGDALKTLITRTLTAAVFVATLLLSTWYSQWTFSLVFLVITLLGVWEFYTLSRHDTSRPQMVMGTIASGLLFISTAAVCLGYFDNRILAVNIPVLFSLFIIELYSKAEAPFRNIAFTLLGIFYVAAPFSLLNYILTMSGQYSFQILFGCWFILWSNDTGAYLGGSAFGRTKLFPRISPGKSWEGSAAGAVAALVVTYIISGWYDIVTRGDWFVIAGIMIVIGTIGDLCESLYKRSLGVKDSGKLLPGHGGILDRFDSLLMSAPFIFAYLYLKQLCC